MLRTRKVVRQEIIDLMNIHAYQFLPPLIAEYKKFITN